MKTVSFMDTGDTGYEISAAYMADNGLMVRLFNPSDTGMSGTVRLGMPVRGITGTDLNGNPAGSTSNGNSMIRYACRHRPAGSMRILQHQNSRATR